MLSGATKSRCPAPYGGQTGIRLRVTTLASSTGTREKDDQASRKRVLHGGSLKFLSLLDLRFLRLPNLRLSAQFRSLKRLGNDRRHANAFLPKITLFCLEKNQRL